MDATLWTYQARCLRVVDGDTLDVYLDAGFRRYGVERLRLLGVNAPEVHAKDSLTRMAAQRATAAVLQWVDACTGEWPLILHAEKSDAFGRWLATVTTRDGDSLNQYLLDSGNAVPFR